MWAAMVKVEVPPLPLGGVPLIVAVPSPLSLKLAHPGRPLCPPPVDSARLGVGFPDVVTVNDPRLPVAKVVAASDVMAGAASTVSVKFWVASADTPPLDAVIAIG